MTRLKSSNKYGARRTWSALCNTWFDSHAEAAYGEKLYLMEKAGAINDLKFHQTITLSKSPKVTIGIDFIYNQNGKKNYADYKGMKENREYRAKRIWLKQFKGIDVKLIRAGGSGESG